MTKKSQARLERDAAKKEYEKFKEKAKPWDDLKNIYQDCKNMLCNVPTQIAQLYSVERIEEFLENRNITSNLIRCLSDDIKQMNQELETIYAGHKDRSGKANDEQEFLNTLSFVEAYNSFNVKFEGVIMPNVTELGKQFDYAVSKVNEILEKDKQNNVSDAVVLEEASIEQPKDLSNE